MKLIIFGLLRYLGCIFLTKKAAILVLKLLASYSSNKVDDNVVLLVEAAMSSDLDSMDYAIEGLQRSIKDLMLASNNRSLKSKQ